MRTLRDDPWLLRHGQLIPLLLLLACDSRGPAELYRDALAASTWEDARDTCLQLPEQDAGDCLVAVMEESGRLEPGDCDVVPIGTWRDECLFLYAERVARRGETAAGFAACEGTRFGRECTYHLIREGARAALTLDLPAAAVRAGSYTGLRLAPDAERLFWKSWFHERMRGDQPVDPTECPTAACVDGARETVIFALNGMARANRSGFCAGPPPNGTVGGRVLWRDTAHTQAWVREFTLGECQGRAAGRPGPPPTGPAGGPAPGLPPG